MRVGSSVALMLAGTALGASLAWVVSAPMFQEAPVGLAEELAATTELGIVNAIIAVESGGDCAAFNEAEDAAGILQIRPIMVQDVNRILGHETYTLEDRWSASKPIDMLTIYTDHYTPGWEPELVARRWNGGPRGDEKDATLDYWKRVRKHLPRRGG